MRCKHRCEPAGRGLFFTCRCETRNHLWLVLEYCVGGDLATLLKEEPVLSEDSVRGFGQDLALALQHVHANGLVNLSPHITNAEPSLST